MGRGFAIASPLVGVGQGTAFVSASRLLTKPIRVKNRDQGGWGNPPAPGASEKNDGKREAEGVGPQ